MKGQIKKKTITTLMIRMIVSCDRQLKKKGLLGKD